MHERENPIMYVCRMREAFRVGHALTAHQLMWLWGDFKRPICTPAFCTPRVLFGDELDNGDDYFNWTSFSFIVCLHSVYFID